MPLDGPFPKPGDLIEFFRPLYQHWGVYVGNGYVVHLTDQEGWSSVASAFGATAVVRKDRVEKVAAGCRYKVNNKYDQKRQPNPPEKVVRAALEQVGNEMPYSVTNANCEHFVTDLRYGNKFCDQVDNAKTYALVGGGALALGIGAALMISTMRNKRQNQ
ncbi:phospholipase A and acyltransferase 3-like [Discoglossus pictus]